MNNKPVILVLNDEPTVHALFKEIVEMAGGCYVCLHATNDRQALELLRTQPVNLLIQDLLRPTGWGVKFYMILKADKKLRHIPVLFLTGSPRSALSSIEEEMIAFGDDYMDVPFGDDLLILVNKMLSRHKFIPTASSTDLLKV